MKKKAKKLKERMIRVFVPIAGTRRKRLDQEELDRITRRAADQALHAAMYVLRLGTGSVVCWDRRKRTTRRITRKEFMRMVTDHARCAAKVSIAIDLAPRSLSTRAFRFLRERIMRSVRRLLAENPLFERF